MSGVVTRLRGRGRPDVGSADLSPARRFACPGMHSTTSSSPSLRVASLKHAPSSGTCSAWRRSPSRQPLLPGEAAGSPAVGSSCTSASRSRSSRRGRPTRHPGGRPGRRRRPPRGCGVRRDARQPVPRLPSRLLHGPVRQPPRVPPAPGCRGGTDTRRAGTARERVTDPVLGRGQRTRRRWGLPIDEVRRGAGVTRLAPPDRREPTTPTRRRHPTDATRPTRPDGAIRRASSRVAHSSRRILTL